MRFTAAAIQYEPVFAEKTRNLDALLALAKQAARAGAKLIVLPEMATTGHGFRNRSEIAPLVEPVPEGPTVRAFADLAAQFHVHIVVGMPEVDSENGAFYNAAVLVGPQGYIGHYRKTHTHVDDTRWARDGDLGLPVFATELGRIGVQICLDIDYCEPSRVQALAGADVIALLANWQGDRTVWRARAIENGLYMVVANRWGEERGERYCGYTEVIDPSGTILNMLSMGDGLALAEVDTDMAQAARLVALAPRCPGEYQELLLSSYLWAAEAAHQLPPGRRTVVAVAATADPTRMQDHVRWADKQARDRGWPKLDLAVFPYSPIGPDLTALEEVASRLDCHIVWGAPEPEGYQTAWLMGPEGLAGRYRQMHVETGAQPGDEGLPTFDLPWGRLGLLMGGDLPLPEAMRILAKRGADLVAAPVEQGTPRDSLLWMVRAQENETLLAVSAAEGRSCLIQPGQFRPTDCVPGMEMALALVDTGAERVRSKALLRRLQPRWYDTLVLH